MVLQWVIEQLVLSPLGFEYETIKLMPLFPISKYKYELPWDMFPALEIKKMESSLNKCFCLLGIFLVILSISEFSGVDGAGPCGNNSPDAEAINMVPCATAAQDAKASVSSRCCSQVKKIGQNPSCLCAILLSNTAKMAGIRPDIAITIPKRCNFADRPVGYKCGRKLKKIFLPFLDFSLCFPSWFSG